MQLTSDYCKTFLAAALRMYNILWSVVTWVQGVGVDAMCRSSPEHWPSSPATAVRPHRRGRAPGREHWNCSPNAGNGHNGHRRSNSVRTELDAGRLNSVRTEFGRWSESRHSHAEELLPRTCDEASTGTSGFVMRVRSDCRCSSGRRLRPPTLLPPALWPLPPLCYDRRSPVSTRPAPASAGVAQW